MATTVDHLPNDSYSRFSEMKSVQPYSTTDEYLYAMKEDLADWLSNMYPDCDTITADNFLECLENGVLLCQHANNVNNAVRRAYSLKSSSISSKSVLEYCKYRVDARPQTFNARDNVSQFIKWARRVVGVREVLMFESDDLILRKNEKNFLLCLLEIARYGSQFGVSVPALIQLENEIEQEIERDKQTEIMSFTELRRLKREENQKSNSNSSIHAKYSKLLKFVRNENMNSQTRHATPKNSYNQFSLSHSNGANWLRQRISRIPKFTHNHNKKQRSKGDIHDNTICSDVSSRHESISEENFPQTSRTLTDYEEQVEIPKISSSLHRTVEQMTNTCCCEQRFPVVRLGEGKYRIGEHGTIIFIRILRYHVMVRVGGGWDTLENYLNKHDPCRRAGQLRLMPQNHHTDIPIRPLATNTLPSYGKSMKFKTDEFLLSKPSTCDTNLTDAQLVITRDPDGRHHIGQIAYKNEENVNQQNICRHLNNNNNNNINIKPQTSPKPKIKSARGTGQLVSTSFDNQSSYLDRENEYSTYDALSSLTDNQIFTVSNNDIRQYKTELTVQFSPKLNKIKDSFKEIRQSVIPISSQTKLGFTESITDNIDGYITPTAIASEPDFNISDIEDAMRAKANDDDDADRTQMDEDSLESCEGVLEIKRYSAASSAPNTSEKYSTKPSVTSNGICTALYLAQKQKQQASNENKTTPFFYTYTRSNTLSNVVDIMKKDEKINAKTLLSSVAQRSKSTEFSDISKLDRDSGFDEQDFHGDILHSSYDDNSSVSSSKSLRSSINYSVSSDLNRLPYRENKAYELRLKARDHARILNEQSPQNSPIHLRRNYNKISLQINDSIPVPIHKYKKNAQKNYLKYK